MAAGDVTDALVDELALIMEDPNETRFPEATKLIFLNKAQRQLCNLLHDAYLTELEEVETDLDGSGGSVAFSDLTYDVLRGAEGIKRVKVDVGGAGTTDLYATRVGLDELKKFENQYLDYADTAPRYYIFDENIYILIDTLASTDVDVWYLKVPDTMATDADPEINESLHGIMLTLAEARLWGMDSKLERKRAALEQALQEIETLNSRYRRPDGIGTMNREVAEQAAGFKS